MQILYSERKRCLREAAPEYRKILKNWANEIAFLIFNRQEFIFPAIAIISVEWILSLKDDLLTIQWEILN